MKNTKNIRSLKIDDEEIYRRLKILSAKSGVSSMIIVKDALNEYLYKKEEYERDKERRMNREE